MSQGGVRRRRPLTSSSSRHMSSSELESLLGNPSSLIPVEPPPAAPSAAPAGAAGLPPTPGHADGYGGAPRCTNERCRALEIELAVVRNDNLWLRKELMERVKEGERRSVWGLFGRDVAVRKENEVLHEQVQRLKELVMVLVNEEELQ
mmetsp:Transcript_25183/g.63007  ORF Transcript_25183/g.63007 Transcript_25183/m.63007 type:complete len:148 (-) Transcript_25183:965-1408(-)